MTADKRSVHTDALETLGTVIGDAEKRDAIHLAVEPIEAGTRLSPGEHMCILNGKAYTGTRGKPVGIVDPFLASNPEAGDRFWLVVYPRRITSLRHVWEHPDFPATVDLLQSETPQVEASTPARSESEVWMRAWAAEHMSADYYGDCDSKRSEDDAYVSAIRAGEDNHIGPYENARDHIDSLWWDHWENITGKRGNREDYFSCAC